MSIVLRSAAGTSINSPYQVTAAGPPYSIVTESSGWNVTNADDQGIRGNVTDSKSNLDGNNSITIAAVAGSPSAALMPQTVSINGQPCSGSAPSHGTAGYSQNDLQNDIAALASGGGQSGYGNPSNVTKWNGTNLASLYRAIVATHAQLFPFMSLSDFAHAGLAEAASESTMDPAHFDGTSMGLLQCTAPTNGADFNLHATAITAADGSTVLDPSEIVSNQTLQDPGINWVVWAWTLRNQGSTGETPHEVSLGQQHAPAGWQGTLHDAMRSWLSGAGLSYNASDYALRGPTYFTKVQTYLNLVAPGDFDRLMATQIPQGQIAHFRDPGAGF